ncbi:MAG: sodium-translocating pyrophosphatase [Candidatus Aenigmatarchaeota archaeon]
MFSELSTMHFSVVASLGALVFAGLLTLKIKKKDRGPEKAREMSGHIKEGAKTFLTQEFKHLAVVAIIIALVLAYFVDPRSAVTFLCGAFLSSLAGIIGMSTATSSNSRTSQGVTQSLGEGLDIAFSSGAVMGMSVVGFGLLGVAGLYLIFPEPEILFGFAFGASSVALFARVGGGIYTKTADMGADLVGKVEEDIPEDDPRNPGVIADNVGDNVGDVAAMGADLFESYVEAIIATMAIGAITLEAAGIVVLPIFVGAVGIVASIIGYFFVRGEDNLHWALNKGTFGAAALAVVFLYFGTTRLFPSVNIGVFYSIIAGLGAGMVIGLVTEYYTASKYKPTQGIAEESTGGPATNIIAGFSTGMISTFVPMITVCAAMIISYYFAGLYGIGIASIGVLSTLGITLATDCYGPVADNAAGIAEMAEMGEEVRERAEALDAIGNTTAAIGKGFAIGSAALASLTLFVTYTQSVGLEAAEVALTDPYIIIGLFIGALLPFIFSALTMRSVGRSASKMIDEIRRQFEEMNILSGDEKPDYSRCIEISTDSALKEMVLPGSIAILSPIVVGLLLGTEALAGMLAGNISTGFLLAVTMANAGGAWDNAKKYVEEGNLGGKGSETHKATVVGDTVGDPMKDTSGPSLNVLIKLVAMTALIFVPLLM